MFRIPLFIIVATPVILQAQGPSSAADFGDLPNVNSLGAPITYATTIIDGGPWHLSTPELFLGTHLDSESDGIASPGGNGDDLDGGPDDEDGVVIPASIQAGTTATFKITVTNQLVSPAYLHSFIDWNGDGTFTGSEETDVVSVLPGTNGAVVSVVFSVPSSATITNQIGARFRLSSVAVDPNGPAPDGEVEDYMISIQPPDYDFGDLPDSSVGAATAYATRLSDNGARHVIVSGLELGGIPPDAEVDGAPDLFAAGDDGAGLDDEDGFGPLTAIQSGTTIPFSHVATNLTANDAWLHGFFDWNGDGDFLDLNETSKVLMPSGSNNLAVVFSVDVPSGIAYHKDVAARLRLTTRQVIGPDGPAPDGEVEDYFLNVLPALDFGDLPDTQPGTAAGDFINAMPDYRTTLADDGPRHLVTPELVLVNDSGSGDADVDFEADAHQSSDADGDDLNGENDEILGQAQFFLIGSQSTNSSLSNCDEIEVAIYYSSSQHIKNDLEVDAYLHSFIDWNQDGDFEDERERFTTVVPSGHDGYHSKFTHSPTMTIPWQGLPSWTGRFATRERLTTDAEVGATGYAPDGEVYDRLLTVTVETTDPCPPPSLDFGDLPDSTQGTSAGKFNRLVRPDYRTLLSDNGPRHVVTPDLSLSDHLHVSDTDAELDGLPNKDASGDDDDGNDDEYLNTQLLSQVSFNLALPVDHSTITAKVATRQNVYNVSGSDAILYGFLDVNRDGDFKDIGEVQTMVIPGDGTVTSALLVFDVTVPWPGVNSWNETFALRLRLSSDATLSAVGPARDGEVQDHLLDFNVVLDSDPRSPGSLPPHVLNFDPISATTGADLILDPQPFLPPGLGPIDELVWSLNGNILPGNPPVLTAQDLAELGKGAFDLTLTFEDENDELYRVDPQIFLRDWPEYDAWAAAKGLVGQDTLPHLDLDGDGRTAEAEFAFGSDPLDFASVPPTVVGEESSGDDSWLIKSILRRSGGTTQFGGAYLADGILYSGDASKDGLGDWSTPAIPIFNPSGLPAPPVGYSWATYRYPAPIIQKSNAFLRVGARLK